jgi:hypothetical protein
MRLLVYFIVQDSVLQNAIRSHINSNSKRYHSIGWSPSACFRFEDLRDQPWMASRMVCFFGVGHDCWPVAISLFWLNESVD